MFSLSFISALPYPAANLKQDSFTVKNIAFFYLRHCDEIGNIAHCAVLLSERPRNTINVTSINLVDGESIQNNPVKVKFQFSRFCLNPHLGG
jgi:hypothetical protein